MIKKFILCLAVFGVSLLLCNMEMIYGRGFFANEEWGARPVGLGGSFVAVADDVNAIIWNPAGIARLNHPEITFMHSQPISLVDFTANYAAFAHPLRTGTIGIGWLNYNYLDKARENVFILSYGMQVNEKTGAGSLFLGGSARYLSVELLYGGIDETKYDTEKAIFTGDIGLLYLLTDNTAVGLLVKNINEPDLIFRRGQTEAENKIMREYDIGIAHNMKTRRGDIVTLTGGVQHTVFATEVQGGIEYWKSFGETLVGLRAGYNPREWAIGGSFRSGNINIDAVYLIQPHFLEGSSGFNISLGYIFGAEVEREVEIEVERKEEIFGEVSIKIVAPVHSLKIGDVAIKAEWLNVEDILNWRLEVEDSAGIKIRTLSGERQLDEYSWDGKDDKGQIVSDGNYMLRLIAETMDRKKIYSNTEEVLIDTTPPELEVTYSVRSFSPDGDGKDDVLTMNVKGSDNMFDVFSIKIFNDAGKQVKSFEGKEGHTEIIWDGRDYVFHNVVPDGNFVVVAEAKDIAGNMKILPKEIITVVVPLKVITKEIELVEEARGLKISLTSKVLFDTGQSEIKSISYSALGEVVSVLNAYFENNIVIEGHTDSVGSSDYNQTLSERRAQSVFNHITAKGIKRDRIEWKGYGEEKPVATNRTRKGRSLNRRVDIIILKDK